VRPSKVEAKASTNVVDDEHHASGRADPFDGVPVPIMRQHVVLENRVVIWRRHEAGNLARVFVDKLLQGGSVVPRHAQD
jgi:hypothetical protein